jgi:hypothetical protein
VLAERMFDDQHLKLRDQDSAARPTARSASRRPSSASSRSSSSQAAAEEPRPRAGHPRTPAVPERGRSSERLTGRAGSSFGKERAERARRSKRATSSWSRSIRSAVARRTRNQYLARVHPALRVPGTFLAARDVEPELLAGVRRVVGPRAPSRSRSVEATSVGCIRSKASCVRGVAETIRVATPLRSRLDRP